MNLPLLLNSVFTHLKATNFDDRVPALGFAMLQLLDYISPLSRSRVFSNLPFLELPFVLCFAVGMLVEARNEPKMTNVLLKPCAFIAFITSGSGLSSLMYR
jgi:hypothetical protein